MPFNRFGNDILTTMTTRDEAGLHSPPDYIPADLLAQATPLQLERGERLFSEGEPVRNLYFVQSGELKAVRVQADGTQTVMIRAHAGDYFAESAMAVERYICHAMAVRKTRLLAFPAAAFRQALMDDGHFSLAFSLGMAAHARRQCSRQERLRLKRARDRILHLLVCEGGPEGVIEWPTSLAEMAEELGLEAETLYRTLSELEREGILARDRRRLQLLDKAPGQS